MKFNIFRRVLLFLIIIGLIILLHIGIPALNEKKAINIKKSIEIENMKEELKEKEEEEKKLEKVESQDISSDDYEKLAREELGLIRKDEIVIKPK